MQTLDQLRSEIEAEGHALIAFEEQVRARRNRLYRRWQEFEMILSADEKASGVNPWPDRPQQESAGVN